MYSYYEELENPDGFYVHLANNLSSNNYKIVDIEELNLDFFVKYNDLFEMLNFISRLVIPDVPSEKQNMYFMSHGDFLLSPRDDEAYSYIIGLSNKVCLDVFEVIEYFSFYLNYLHFYDFMYPDMHDFCLSLKNKIRSALKDINLKRKIELPNDKGVDIKYPNAWYITPQGYLYNTGGKGGHKEGNLVYSYNDICEKIDGRVSEGYLFLRKKDEVIKEENGGQKSVPIIDNHSRIKKILDDGFVDYVQFQNYSNYPYGLVNMFVPGGCEDVSYQKNIITLVVGYLSAREALYRAYGRLNDSKRRKELVNKIGKFCNGEFSDILVRFAGFNKVESQRKRTICTSSLNGISLFKKYLDEGWDLDIIPGIVYDRYIDDISEANLDSIYIKKHLDNEMDNYHGKGKILINHGIYK